MHGDPKVEASWLDSEFSRRALLRKAGTLGVAGTAGLWLAACTSPNVRSFTIEPKAICCGESVTISWDADPDMVVALTPKQTSPATLPTGPKQTLTVVPPCNAGPGGVKVELRVANGSVAKTDYIFTYSEGDLIPITTTGTCRTDGTPYWYKLNQGSPNLVVREVWGDTPTRSVTVTKGGIVAALPYGARSTAFAGIPVAGEWVLSTLPNPDESWCESGTVAGDVSDDPATLKIQVMVGCKT